MRKHGILKFITNTVKMRWRCRFVAFGERTPADIPAAKTFEIQTLTGFTTASPVDTDLSGGTYLEGDRIVTTVTGVRQEICHRGEIRIIGKHNVENVMAAATYAVLCGCPLDAIRRVLATFPGLEHALEIVCERRGVRFVNDSKGTNVDATLKALESIDQPIWLIAGGRDKGGDFSRLAQAVSRRVTRVILIGEAAPLLRQAWEGVATMTEAATLRDAVDLAA